MSEVKVTIGGDASPLKQVFSQITADAKKFGETLGLEIGNKAAMKDDLRYERSLDRFLRVLSGSGDPVQVFTAAIESMGKAFRIAGMAMLGVAVGAFMYDQVEKAIEAHKKLQEKLEKPLKINIDNESIHQMQRDVDGFEGLKEEYASRGLIERILFGDAEDQMFKQVESLNTIKKNLIEIEEIRKNTVKSQARILAVSENPEDRKRSHQLLKAIDDDQAQKDAKQQMDDAVEARTKTQDALAKVDERLAVYKQHPRGAGLMVKELTAQRGQLVEELKNNGNLIASINEEQAANQRATTAENAAISTSELDAFNKEQTRLTEAELKKRYELTNQADDAGATSKEKIDNLKSKIAKEQAEDPALARLQTEAQRLAEQNKLLEDQIKLKDLLKQNDLERAKLHADVFQNLIEQSEARGAAAAAGEEAMGFHGASDSMRRQGFAGRVGPNQNSPQLKALGDANKHLAKLVIQGDYLNGKIDGI